jgi:Rrf2 family transcriptional regulator, nitric oxide-sensitive transcriptional repressor
MMQTRCIYSAQPKHAIQMHQKFRRCSIRLTRHTDYALRILLEAATSPERRLSIAEVASEHRIPKNNVMKVVNQLANAGLLATVRGRGGGFTLGRPAETITLGEVVRLTEPDLKPADCGGCALSYGCGMEPMLGAAIAAFLRELDSQTLAEAARRSTFRTRALA